MSVETVSVAADPRAMVHQWNEKPTGSFPWASSVFLFFLALWPSGYCDCYSLHDPVYSVSELIVFAEPPAHVLSSWEKELLFSKRSQPFALLSS